MEKIYSRTKTIQEDKVSGFCPGCMHSTVIKLIGEVLDEMNLVDRAASVLGIGCCGLHMDYIAYDTTTAPHGRACSVATGMKRANLMKITVMFSPRLAAWMDSAMPMEAKSPSP